MLSAGADQEPAPAEVTPIVELEGVELLALVAGGKQSDPIGAGHGNSGQAALAGVAIARADGVTLHAPKQQLKLLQGLCLDYRGDLSGGGFLIRSADGITPCACGSAFSRR